MKGVLLRVSAVLATLMVTMFPASGVTMAHDGDEGGACSGNYKFVVYEHNNLLGANDDFCFYTFDTTSIYTVGDPNVDSNDPASSGPPYVPSDDVGNRYLMGCCISSYSIKTTVAQDACIALYSGYNYQGIVGTIFIHGSVSGHDHQNLGILENDRTHSFKFYMNYRDYMC